VGVPSGLGYQVSACVQNRANDFGDDQIGLTIDGQPPAVGEPFADQAVILRVAGSGAVRAEIEIASVQGDEGLATGAVLGVFGILRSESGHSGALLSPRAVYMALAFGIVASLPNADRYVNSTSGTI
jgi:hypothetical protein